MDISISKMDIFALQVCVDSNQPPSPEQVSDCYMEWVGKTLEDHLVRDPNLPDRVKTAMSEPIKWVLIEEPAGDPTRVECAEREGYFHYVFGMESILLLREVLEDGS